jgi:hypothetical protein
MPLWAIKGCINGVPKNRTVNENVMKSWIGVRVMNGTSIEFVTSS